MNKVLSKVAAAAVANNTWKKFTNPTVNRGKTAFPKTDGDLEKFGVRYDLDGEVTINDTVYNKFQLQPNAGQKIPSTIKEWRNANAKGTHAVMADVYVKKDGTKEDVEAGLKAANEKVQGRSKPEEEKKEKDKI